MAGVYTLIKDHQIYDTTHKFHLNIKWEKSHRYFNSFNRDSFRKKGFFPLSLLFFSFRALVISSNELLYCCAFEARASSKCRFSVHLTCRVLFRFIFNHVICECVCVCASVLIFQWKLNISTPLLVAKWLVFDSVERLWIPCCACKTSKGLGYCDGGCKNLESVEVRALVKVPQIELRWLFCTNNSSCFSMRAYHMSAR